jgi:hypothetical protein
MFRALFASIVRNTTVAYSHRFFMVLVCLFHGAGTGVGTVSQFSAVSYRLSITDRAKVTKD